MRDVFRLLADPTRRRLLAALRGGERAVNDLVGETRISQPGVSKQLRILRESGVAAVRRDGRRHLYSIRGPPLREASEWLRRYERFWQEHRAEMDGPFAHNTPRKEGSEL